MNKTRVESSVALVAVCVAALIGCQPAAARTQLKNICRLKGQEENVLRGLGLVVGLNGTGEPNDPATMRAIARAMQIMGDGEQGGLEELKKIKNVAMVMVTATIPATGARRGDQVDCYVSALNGKSLVGGRLAFASLLGPNTNDTRVYALCEGQVVVDDLEQPMVGVVLGGCQIGSRHLHAVLLGGRLHHADPRPQSRQFSNRRTDRRNDQQPIPREPQLRGRGQARRRKKTSATPATRPTSASASRKCIATIRSASPPTCSTSSSTSTNRSRGS